MLFREDSLNRKNARHQVSRQEFENIYKDIDLVNVQKLVDDKDRHKDGILKGEVSECKMPHRVPTVRKYCSMVNICRGSIFGRR